MAEKNSDDFAVCSWSLGATDVDDLVVKVHATGLQYVQLALNTHRDDVAIALDAHARLADAGITAVSGMFGALGEDYSTPATIHATGGFIVDRLWPQNWALAQAVAYQAQAMGLHAVSTHAGFLPVNLNEPRATALLERLGAIARLFADHGVVLMLETGQETAETLMAVLQHFDDQQITNVAVNFDPANMLLYDMGDPVVALRTVVSHLGQVHIKDATRPGVSGQWGEDVVVGRGEVDWLSFVRILRRSGYSGKLVIEREAGESRVDDVRAAVEFLSPML